MDAELRVVTERLSARFADLDVDLVEVTVEREANRLRDASVQSFLPLLVERAARREFDARRADHARPTPVSGADRGATAAPAARAGNWQRQVRPA